jgi:hypothetical protein
MRINARLGDEESLKFKFILDSTKESVSEIIKQSLSLYYNQIKKRKANPSKALARYTGCFKGEKHLSTNYKEILTKSIEEKL